MFHILILSFLRFSLDEATRRKHIENYLKKMEEHVMANAELWGDAEMLQKTLLAVGHLDISSKN